MPDYQSIPDFSSNPDSMAEALRAVKSILEQVTGQHQDDSLGAPQVFVLATAPKQDVVTTIRKGDFWINDATRTLYWWDGIQWQQVGTQITPDQAQEIADLVSNDFLTVANATLATAVNARDLAVQAQTDAQVSADLSAVYKASAESARNSALTYRDQAQTAEAGSQSARNQAQTYRDEALAAVAGIDATVQQEITAWANDATSPFGILSTNLQNNYYTITGTNAAISGQITTLQSNLQGQINTTNARLTNDYWTSVTTSAAISSATTSLKSSMEGPTGSIGLINAALTTDYYTKAQTDSVVSSATTTLQSNLQNQINATNANLTNNYWTGTTTNAAISSATTTLKSQLEAPTGSIGLINAKLVNDYYTAAQTTAAISAANSTLQSNLQGQINSTNSNLSTNYLTSAQTNSAITSAVTSLQSNLQGQINSTNSNLSTNYQTTTATNLAISQAITNYNTTLTGSTGAVGQLNANLSTNYYTKTQTDSAISSSITTYNATLTGPTGTVGQLSANLTANYYTKTATDTAISTQINTYDASIAGGVKASVISNSTAITTLQGNATASIGFRTQAGSAGALLELVSLANPAGAASTARIAANNIILDGTVTFNKFAAANSANLLQNTDLASGTLHWSAAFTGTAQTTFSLRSPGQSYAGATYPTLMLFQNGSATDSEAGIWSAFWKDNATQVNYGPAVTPNAWYEVSVQISTIRCKADIIIQFFDVAGTLLSATTVATQTNVPTSSTNPETWPRIGGKAQAPASAAYMALVVYKYGTLSSTSSYVFVHKPYAGVTYSTATDLAPYSVGGSTIIDGASIKTGSITAASAVIADGAITNAKIGNLQVDSAKIADLTVGTQKISLNAATVPVSGTRANINLGGGSTGMFTAITLTFTGIAGQPVIVGSYGAYSPGGDTLPNVYIRLNGTVLAQNIMSGLYTTVDTPVTLIGAGTGIAGTNTVDLLVNITYYSQYAYNMTLFALQAKR